MTDEAFLLLKAVVKGNLKIYQYNDACIKTIKNFLLRQDFSECSSGL